MHCTSPGRDSSIHPVVQQNYIGMDETNDSEEHIIMMDDILLVRGEFPTKNSEEKIYDDPYELMMADDWTSPVHFPRSRSWLCCPNASAGVRVDEPVPTSRCEYASLVTAQPKAVTRFPDDPVI